MGKQVDQGTRWESRIVTRALAVGRAAMRLPKTGKKNEPDLVIFANGEDGLGVSPGNMRLAVAWERWVRPTHHTNTVMPRRRATRMFVVDEDTFYELLDTSPLGWYIQAKSTQAGSLSAWLEGLQERMEQDGMG